MTSSTSCATSTMRSTRCGGGSTTDSLAATGRSSRANATPCCLLSLEGKQALRKLFKANKRLNVAYLLKESFGQLWDYETEGWARRFFDRWRDSLRWQRLDPYVKFAKMIDRHWEGIASYCHPENKFNLGMVEGLNNQIRVLQRRAYGYRDEDYLKLKIVAAFLPPLGRRASNDPL